MAKDYIEVKDLGMRVEYVRLDRVLEIIDKYATFIFGNGLSEENQIALWDDMRDKVLDLKGGEQDAS